VRVPRGHHDTGDHLRHQHRHGQYEPDPDELGWAGDSGGVFLVPGESYKFVYKDDSVTTCVPDTGVTLFTVDNVSAVPGSASSVDVSSATAGESIAAGDAVFLSNGSNSLNAGQWYRTDSDFTYKSTAVAMVGIAPSAITSGASGSVRIAGAVTVTGPLSTGPPITSARHRVRSSRRRRRMRSGSVWRSRRPRW
jgi:hypothetical protein